MHTTTDHDSRPNGTLLALAREGNEDAFTELVRRNWRMIYRISRKVLKNHEDAEDTLQNVLVKVYQRLGGIEESSRFTSWLFRVTFNEALMTLRRNRSRHVDNCVDIHAVDATGRGASELQDTRTNNERQHMNRELASKATASARSLTVFIISMSRAMRLFGNGVRHGRSRNETTG